MHRCTSESDDATAGGLHQRPVKERPVTRIRGGADNGVAHTVHLVHNHERVPEEPTVVLIRVGARTQIERRGRGLRSEEVQQGALRRHRIRLARKGPTYRFHHVVHIVRSVQYNRQVCVRVGLSVVGPRPRPHLRLVGLYLCVQCPFLECPVHVLHRTPFVGRLVVRPPARAPLRHFVRQEVPACCSCRTEQHDLWSISPPRNRARTHSVVDTSLATLVALCPVPVLQKPLGHLNGRARLARTHLVKQEDASLWTFRVQVRHREPLVRVEVFVRLCFLAVLRANRHHLRECTRGHRGANLNVAYGLRPYVPFGVVRMRCAQFVHVVNASGFVGTTRGKPDHLGRGRRRPHAKPAAFGARERHVFLDSDPDGHVWKRRGQHLVPRLGGAYGGDGDSHRRLPDEPTHEHVVWLVNANQVPDRVIGGGNEHRPPATNLLASVHRVNVCDGHGPLGRRIGVLHLDTQVAIRAGIERDGGGADVLINGVLRGPVRHHHRLVQQMFRLFGVARRRHGRQHGTRLTPTDVGGGTGAGTGLGHVPSAYAGDVLVGVPVEARVGPNRPRERLAVRDRGLPSGTSVAIPGHRRGLLLRWRRAVKPGLVAKGGGTTFGDGLWKIAEGGHRRVQLDGEVVRARVHGQ